MKRQSFWSEEAIQLLTSLDRKDLIDKGDALAERVAALLLTSLERLNQYSKFGNLYNGQGGKDISHTIDPIGQIEDFVNVRLKAEIKALEKLLEVFDELSERESVRHPMSTDPLPDWY